MGRLQIITHTLVLVPGACLANALLIVALLLKPFSESTSWGLACWTAETFWSYMQRHWEHTLNARAALRIRGDAIPPGESAVVISNHQMFAEWYLVQALAVRAGMLGRCRYFAKKEIVYTIPIFGFAFWALGMILVSRNWTQDHARIEEAFSRVKRNRHATWIVLYPEGTRRTPQKILAAQAYARQHGKPELQRVLLPRTKGFVATIQGLRDSHVQYLYDLTFLYESPGKNREAIPTLGDQLGCDDLAAAGYRYTIDVRRVKIADLPPDEEGLKRWCEEAWVRKDKLLAEWLDADQSNDPKH